uniref:T9SS type A sorting domain-containing protein n=1 Tax=candidate division WOR-3 bacterium TaxID=2052148 RepID=A0A7C4XJJ6_UNCW3
MGFVDVPGNIHICGLYTAKKGVKMKKMLIITLGLLITTLLSGYNVVPGITRGTEGEIPHQVISQKGSSPIYIPATRQGSILFVEDYSGAFGPASHPDPNWQTVLNNIVGAGNYGWYQTTATGQNGPDLATMQSYDLVIWNCYDDWWTGDALTATDQTNIQSYMTGGGKVWLIGQDIIYSGCGSFVQSNFHVASYVEDVNSTYTANIQGQAELSGLNTTFNCDYAANSFYEDGLTPDAQAHTILFDAGYSIYPAIAYPNSGNFQSSFWAIDGRNPTDWATWEQMVHTMLDKFGVLIALDHDVGVLSINIPSIVPENTTINPTATVKNFGTNQESFNVTCTINPGSYTSTYSVSNLPAGSTLDITFPGPFTFVSGFYTVTVYTQLAGDQNPGNDTLTKQVEATNWLYYDDGSAYNAWAWYYMNNGWGVQFPLGAEVWVDSIAAHFWDTSWPSPGGNTATFRIYDGASQPTNLRWELANTTITRGAWNKIPVDTTLTHFSAGDNLYVFYIQAADYPNCPGFSIDAAVSQPNYMWQLLDGAFSVANQGGDWLLRAHIIPVTGIGEWISLTPENGLLRVSTITNGKADVKFAIPEATKGSLVVYDASGRLCATLVSGSLSAGVHTQTFNLDLSSGVYFYNLKTESGINITQKFLIVR